MFDPQEPISVTKDGPLLHAKARRDGVETVFEAGMGAGALAVDVDVTDLAGNLARVPLGLVELDTEPPALVVESPERGTVTDDEKVWVDGATPPTHIGTGTEDHGLRRIARVIGKNVVAVLGRAQLDAQGVAPVPRRLRPGRRNRTEQSEGVRATCCRPQRSRAAWISSSEGSGFLSSRALAVTTKPGVQKPHCMQWYFT